MPHSTPPAARVARLATLFGAAAFLALQAPGALAGTESARDGADALASLDAILASFQSRMSAELDPRPALAMRQTLTDTTQRHVDALVARSDTQGFMSKRIDERIDRDLMTLADELRTEVLASGRDGGDERAPARESGRSAGGRMRLDSGSLELAHATLARVSNRPVSLRHRFSRPFERAPQVTLGVRAVQLPNGEQAQVGLRIVDVDRTGFAYEVHTWGGATARNLTADWVAYSRSGDEGPVPASR